MPSIADLVRHLNTTDADRLEEGWGQIRAALPEGIPDLIAAYPQVRRYQGRVRLLMGLLRYAARDDVLALGLQALQDASTLVRYRACALLAFAQRQEAIPPLQALLRHPDRKTAEDAQAAIDAIERQNRHFFLDRQHTGRIFINLPDDPLPHELP